MRTCPERTAAAVIIGLKGRRRRELLPEEKVREWKETMI
jgi:hypothetical protein